MKKEYIYIIILISAIIAVLYGIVGLINTKYKVDDEAQSKKIENVYYENEVAISTAFEKEKISPNCSFALKKYYDECSHFDYEEAELPKELVNLTEDEVENFYDDWEVEEFSPNKLVLSKEINGYCDQHFIIKLDNEMVKIYQIGKFGELNEYENTEISKDYLPENDIEKLELGIPVYGEGKLSSVLEDYE